MIIPSLTFDMFFNQNKDLLNYPVKSYPINEENFARWIGNHSEPYKEAALEFRLKTRHVSFSEFKQTIGNVCADIVKYTSKFKPNKIILFVESNVRKSNFYVAFYIYSLLRNYFDDLIIITDVKDFTIVEPNDLLIIPDDASYSGSQILSVLRRIPRDIQGTGFIAIPYISKKAYNDITSTFSSRLFNIIFSDKTETFDRLHGDSGKHTIYFDHKLADIVSIYESVYAIGDDSYKGDREDVTGDPNFIYEKMSLITGCDVQPTDYLNNNRIDPSKQCPPPFYKFLNYKFMGDFVRDIDEIARRPSPPPDFSALKAFPGFSVPPFAPAPAKAFPGFSVPDLSNFSGSKKRSSKKRSSKKRSSKKRSSKNIKYFTRI